MKITPQEINLELNRLWPDLEYIWKWDSTFWRVSPAAIQKALDLSNVPTMDFIPEFNDCDDFGLQFLAECRRKRYQQWKQGNLPEEQKFPVAVGFAFGDSWRGIGKTHVGNIALCSDGNVYLIDATPAEKRMWKADPANDNMLFVFM